MRQRWDEGKTDDGVQSMVVVRLNKRECKNLLAIEREYTDCVTLPFQTVWLDNLPEIVLWQSTSNEQLVRWGDNAQSELQVLNSMVCDDLRELALLAG